MKISKLIEKVNLFWLFRSNLDNFDINSISFGQFLKFSIIAFTSFFSFSMRLNLCTIARIWFADPRCPRYTLSVPFSIFVFKHFSLSASNFATGAETNLVSLIFVSFILIWENFVCYWEDSVLCVDRGKIFSIQTFYILL